LNASAAAYVPAAPAVVQVPTTCAAAAGISDLDEDEIQEYDKHEHEQREQELQDLQKDLRNLQHENDQLYALLQVHMPGQTYRDIMDAAAAAFLKKQQPDTAAETSSA
jgi:hypothetical protein